MSLDRQTALWQTRTLRDERLPLFESIDATDDTALDQLPSLTPSRDRTECQHPVARVVA